MVTLFHVKSTYCINICKEETCCILVLLIQSCNYSVSLSFAGHQNKALLVCRDLIVNIIFVYFDYLASIY